MKRPSPSMHLALRRAVDLQKRGFDGQGWVTSRYRRTREALVCRGLAEEYRVTPRGKTVYYRITDAGRELVNGGAS